MKNIAERMLLAMTYDGNRFKHAWIAGLATYYYTRAHDGAVVSPFGHTISFGRWYSFCCAVRVAWEELWRTRP